MTAVAILFWLCAGLIVYTHAGYPLVLRALLALRRHPPETWPGLAEDDPPLRPRPLQPLRHRPRWNQPLPPRRLPLAAPFPPSP